MTQNIYKLQIVCQELGVQEETVLDWVTGNLVKPLDFEAMLFDEEDLARMRFIDGIQKTFAANNESIEVILHLLDQIHILQVP